MLAVTAYVDGIDLSPSNWREWREVLEYGTSIALAFGAGNILAALLFQILSRTHFVQRKAERGGVLDCPSAGSVCRQGGAAAAGAAHPGCIANRWTVDRTFGDAVRLDLH